MFCTNCGHEIDFSSKFCGFCGAKQNTNNNMISSCEAHFLQDSGTLSIYSDRIIFSSNNRSLNLCYFYSQIQELNFSTEMGLSILTTDKQNNSFSIENKSNADIIYNSLLEIKSNYPSLNIKKAKTIKKKI